MYKIIALVPMKGHSERVKNKNMKDFCGNPLFYRIMNSLSNSKYITSIIIDTDSELIANNALKNFSKVKIINRPIELQGDFVSMNKIINHDINQMEEEHFLQTHSTNPLITTKTIDKAIVDYFSNLDKYDSLFGVTKIQSRLYWNDGSPINHNPNELIRTQDLPKVFEENSNIYIFSKNSFKLNNEKRIGIKPNMFEIDKIEAIDIDEEIDFKLAEVLYKLKNGDRYE